MAFAVSAQNVVDVEFVSPKIARVRYTENDKFTGNNTISVVYRDKVRVDSAATADGKLVEHTSLQDSLPMELRVYPGCDCEFTMYEDSGDGYGYENGEYSTYTLRWDDSCSRLTIDSRTGSYAGMPAERVFKVSLLGGKTKTVRYKGKKITVKL